jgi:hypothetical protein
MANKKDPSYVRLAAHRAQTVLADVRGGTGWSISGIDVKPFPTNPNEADFVRSYVRSGSLEPCSRAEYEEIQDLNDEEFDSEHDRSVAAAEFGEAVAASRAAPEPVEPAPVKELPNSGSSASGLPPAPPAEEASDEGGDEIDSLGVKELRTRLKAADQPTSGNKKELQERLRSLG